MSEATEGSRREYARELDALDAGVVRLGSMVSDAISRSTDAIRRKDVELANAIIADDRKINELRWRLEDDSLMLIATQAPMAGDLRRILAALHILTDLERMGDHAAVNASICRKIGESPAMSPPVDLGPLSEIAESMLDSSVRAFIERDETLARETVSRDDEADALFDDLYRELIAAIGRDTSTIDQATQLLWAAHNLERIADRATNICERVVFVVTGRQEELEVSTY